MTIPDWRATTDRAMRCQGPEVEMSLGEVDASWRELYRRGLAALKKNEHTTAIQIFNTILEKEPGFVQCRETLHAARTDAPKRVGCPAKHPVDTVRAVAWLAEAGFFLHSHPTRAIYAAEQALNHDPSNILAHRILAKAALVAGLPRTALLSLRFILQHAITGTGVSVELATALESIGETSQAVAICGRLLKRNPGSKAVNRLLKQLMRSAKSRSRLTSVAEPRTHDQPQEAGPTSLSRHAGSNFRVDLENEILHWETLLRHGPNNHRILKKLGALYARKLDYDRALEYCWRALQLAHGCDAESERAISEIGNLKRDNTKAGTTVRTE